MCTYVYIYIYIYSWIYLFVYHLFLFVDRYTCIYTYIYMDRLIYTHNLNLANTPTKVNKMPCRKYRVSEGVVLWFPVYPSYRRKACAINETIVRLRNLHATTPQHIRCSLLAHQWATPGCKHQRPGQYVCGMHVQFLSFTTSPSPSGFDTFLAARRCQNACFQNPGFARSTPELRRSRFGRTLFCHSVFEGSAGGRVVQPEVHG